MLGLPILGLATTGCGSQGSAAAQAETRDPHQLVTAGATLLDVRTPEEFAEGHLEGAVLIPVAELSTRMAEIPRDRPIVAYCRSGARSERATEVLREAGYDVFDLGAMRNW
jgi:rhodanese-related sulfurtransferase